MNRIVIIKTIIKTIFKIAFKIAFKTSFEITFEIIFKIIKKQFIDSTRKRRLMQFRYNFIKKKLQRFKIFKMFFDLLRF